MITPRLLACPSRSRSAEGEGPRDRGRQEAGRAQGGRGGRKSGFASEKAPLWFRWFIAPSLFEPREVELLERPSGVGKRQDRSEVRE